MKEEPFSLVNDGLSDTGLKKMNAVAVNLHDVNHIKKVECNFYDMCVTTGTNSGKAENHSQLLMQQWRTMVSAGII